MYPLEKLMQQLMACNENTLQKGMFILLKKRAKNRKRVLRYMWKYVSKLKGINNF